MNPGGGEPETPVPEILLYNPPALSHPKPLMPLSLLTVAAVLEGRYPWRLFDGNTRPDAESRVEEAVRNGADILGITVMPGPQIVHALSLSRRLKQMHPRLRIVWGGYFPTLYPEVCLGSGAVDALVLGFGEHTFASLVGAWRTGADITAIPGLAVRDDGGQMIRTSPAPMPHPDQVPPLPYHAIDMEASIRSTFMGRRTASCHSSYGCPFPCSFCSVAAVAQGRWKRQSPETAIRGMAGLVRRYRIDALEIWDNNFFGPESDARAFAEGLKPLRVRWWAQGRVDAFASYSAETWRALADSGLAMVFMGAEAATDAGLAHLGKGGKAAADTTLTVAGLFREHRIIPEFSFVLGYPPDPEANVRETLAYVRRLKRVAPTAEIIFNTFTPVTNESSLFRATRAEGFAFPRTIDEWVQPEWQDFLQRRGARLPWMSDRLRRRIVSFQRVLNAYYPTSADPNLTPAARRLSRAVAAWRYHLGFYAFPLELSLLRRLVPYQRPETSGF